jgi:hypothetical protein
MRNVVIGVAILGLAAVTANCSGTQGLNSANDIVGPSVLQVVGDASTPNLSTRTKGGGNNGHGNGNGGGISVPDPISMTVVIANNVGADAVSYGDTVTFDISGDAPSGAFISVICQQGSSVVATSSGSPSGSSFTLSSNSWTGGEATCDARLFTWTTDGKTTTLATLSFPVAA